MYIFKIYTLTTKYYMIIETLLNFNFFIFMEM